jgi:SAM-dependent methyltransferase
VLVSKAGGPHLLAEPRRPRRSKLAPRLTEKPQSDAGSKPAFDRAATGREARQFFEQLWSESDPWKLDASALDQRRYARQLALLGDRRYLRALEIGCATGSFTRKLAPLCTELVAIDISEHAIKRARATPDTRAGIQYRVANVMELDFEREGAWDLVVLTETAYYLGWQYPMFEVGWLAHSLHQATRAKGRLLLVNTFSGEEGIMSPWLIHSYRDLFRNAGYAVETEETMRGTKETVEFEILLSLFVKDE